MRRVLSKLFAGNKNRNRGSQRRRPNIRRLSIEPLEDRRVLALAIDLVNAFDTGLSNTDNITNTTASDTVEFYFPLLLGTKPFAAGNVFIFDNGVIFPQITATPSPPGASVRNFFSNAGSPITLSEGVHNLNLAVGYTNVSIGVPPDTSIDTFEASIQIIVDQTAPLTPAAPDLLAQSDTGMFNNDTVTRVDAPSFQGSGVERNTIVRLFADGVVVGEDVVGSDGSYLVESRSLADGTYNFTVHLEDVAGNQSVQSAPLQVTIDTVAPNLPSILLTSDTGRSGTDNITRGVLMGGTPFNRQVTVELTVGNNDGVAGNAFPNDISYRLYDLFEGETLIDQGGLSATDFYQRTVQLATGNGVGPGIFNNDGLHPLKLVTTDRAGNLSSEYLLDVIYDTVAPNVSILGIDPQGTDTGVPGSGNAGTFNDNITSDTKTGFLGTAEADAIVRLYADGVDDGGINNPAEFSLTVAQPLDGNQNQPNGQWKTRFVRDLNNPNAPDNFPFDGLREVIVEAEDAAGNINRVNDQVGDSGQQLDIFIDTQGPQIFDPDGAGVNQAIQAITNGVPNPTFNLFDVKPAQGPTPLVNGLLINVRDLPLRVSQFLYVALQRGSNGNPAENPGNYKLVGDQVGNVSIQNVTVTNQQPVAGQPAFATIQLDFAEPLPDDRFTFTISDDLVDPAGNKLDAESNANEPNGAPIFPSGDGQPGGEFVARFTVDSRPEIGNYAGLTVSTDTNGNFFFDPNNVDATNRDLTFEFGSTSDQRFAGQFVLNGFNAAGRPYDALASYGNVGGGFRLLIDSNLNGAFDAGVDFASSDFAVNGLVVPFDFNPNNPGDEIIIFDGNLWHPFTLSGTSTVVAGTPFTSSIFGFPISGDFDGDGNDDLGTYQADRFFFDLGNGGLTGLGNLDDTIDTFFALGIGERPVAADMDQDGIDDIGLWIPNTGTQNGTAEWRFLLSDFANNPPGTVNALDHPFSPVPLGSDLSAHFGNPFALPLVGNLDPPIVNGIDVFPNARELGLISDEILLEGEDVSGNLFYEFVAGEDGHVVATASYAPSAGGVEVFLYDVNGNLLGKSLPNDNGVIAVVGADEKYVVRLMGNQPDVDLDIKMTGNAIPVLEYIGDQTVQEGEVLVVSLAGSDADLDTLRYSVAVITIEELAYQLDQELGFWTDGEFFENWGGLNEKWLRSTDGSWYFITPDGKLFKWNNNADLATSSLEASLDASYHAELSKLYEAPVPISGLPLANVELSGNSLLITPHVAAGTRFYAIVTATDPFDASDTKSVQIDVTVAVNDPPKLTPIDDQSIAAGESLTIQIAALDPEQDAITYSAKVIGSEAEQLAFDLDQQYGFYSNGEYYENWGGLNEKWFQAANNLWFFITPDGRVFEWDNSSDLNSSTQIAVVDADYYVDPSQLYDAPDPGAAYALKQLAYNLDRQLGLYTTGHYSENWGGLGEKWVKAADNSWYFITPDGSLYQWDGRRELATSTLVAKLDASYHTDPTLLHEAPEPVTVRVVGEQLTITVPLGFTGSFRVRVTAIDEFGAASEEDFAVYLI